MMKQYPFSILEFPAIGNKIPAILGAAFAGSLAMNNSNPNRKKFLTFLKAAAHAWHGSPGLSQEVARSQGKKPAKRRASP
jgi:hypothetical protein